MNCKLSSKTLLSKRQVTTKLNSILSVQLIQSRVTNRDFQFPQDKHYENLEDYILENVQKKKQQLANFDLVSQKHNQSLIDQLDFLQELEGLKDDVSICSNQDKEFQLFKASQSKHLKQLISKDKIKQRQSKTTTQSLQIFKLEKSQRNYYKPAESKIQQKYQRFQQLERERQLKERYRKERIKTQDHFSLKQKEKNKDYFGGSIYSSTILSKNSSNTNINNNAISCDLQSFKTSFENKEVFSNVKNSGFFNRKNSKYQRSEVDQNKFQNFNNNKKAQNQQNQFIKNRFMKKKLLNDEKQILSPVMKNQNENFSKFLGMRDSLPLKKDFNLNDQTQFKPRSHRRESFIKPQTINKIPQQMCNSIPKLTSFNLNVTSQSKYQQKNEKYQISEIFKKSLIIKMQNYLNSQLPNCKQCLLPMNCVNKNLDLQCSLCTKPNNFNNNKQSLDVKIPLMGLLFEIQNFNKISEEVNENNHFGVFQSSYNHSSHPIHSSYNSCDQILKQVTKQITKLEDFLLKLQILKKKLQMISAMRKQTFQDMINSKIQLMRFLKNDYSSPIKKIEEQQETEINIQEKIKEIIPLKYIDQINIWTKIKQQQFTSLPKTYQLLNNQIPYFLRTPTPALLPFLQPITNNFQSNSREEALQLSISTPIQLQNLSLGKVKFIVDGPYLIPEFQHIRRLYLQFQGKRTYRQLSSLIEKIPQSVQQIYCLKYDHKINSHPSGQTFPLMSKLCSIKMCKKLELQIDNIKDEKTDLLQMSRVLSKKKQLKIVLKKNAFSSLKNVDNQEKYLQKQFLENKQRLQNNQDLRKSKGQQNLAILSNIFKRVGKRLIKIHLDLPISLSEQNKQRIYNSIILGGYYKLYSFKLILNSNQNIEVQQQKKKKNKQSFSSQQILNRMLNRKKMIIYALSKHPMRKIFSNKTVKQAVCQMLIGQ